MNTKKLYTVEFLSECMPIYALVPLYFAENAGQNPTQVGVLLAVWLFLTVIFEIPTGIVADKYGKRTALFLGRVARAVCFVLWLGMPHFYGLLFGIVFLAVGDAFISGSLEAYTYDSLNHRARYNRIRQITTAIHLAAFTVAGLISYLLSANYTAIMIASVLMAPLAALSTLLLPKDKVTREDHMTSIKILKGAYHHAVKEHSRKFRFFKASVTTAVFVMFIEQINIFYKSTGVSSKTVALLMTIGNLLTVFLLLSSHRYERYVRRNEPKLYLVLFGLLGVSIYLLQSIPFQIATIFVFVRLLRLMFLSSGNELQHAVTDSRVRATVTSLASFMGRSMGAIGILFVGVASQKDGDIRRPLFIFSVGISLLLLWVTKKANTSPTYITEN